MQWKSLGLAIALAVGLGGCALKGARVPGADIPFAEADYTVMGKTTADTCGTYIFGIDWAHLFSNQAALRTGGGFFGSGNREARRALYLALEMLPDATHLIEPRIETEFNGLGGANWPLFGKRCATVHARGVQIQKTPFSRLND